MIVLFWAPNSTFIKLVCTCSCSAVCSLDDLLRSEQEDTVNDYTVNIMDNIAANVSQELVETKTKLEGE